MNHFQKMKNILERLVKWDDFMESSESMEPDDVLTDISFDARKVLEEIKKDICIWTKTFTREIDNVYWTDYSCCRHGRGRHKTVKSIVPDFCPFCKKPIQLENS